MTRQIARQRHAIAAFQDEIFDSSPKHFQMMDGRQLTMKLVPQAQRSSLIKLFCDNTMFFQYSAGPKAWLFFGRPDFRSKTVGWEEGADRV